MNRDNDTGKDTLFLGLTRPATLLSGLSYTGTIVLGLLNLIIFINVRDVSITLTLGIISYGVLQIVSWYDLQFFDVFLKKMLKCTDFSFSKRFTKTKYYRAF